LTTVLESPQREMTDAVPSRRRTVTQTLCAATHVLDGFADYTVQIMNGSPRAGAPSVTEDPVALLRHAVGARRLRRYRDVACCLILLAVTGLVALQLAGRVGYGPAGLLIGAVAAGWAARRPLWRRIRMWCSWAWRSHKHQRRSGPLGWLVGLGLASALAIVLVLRQPLLWICLAVVLLGLFVGWLVIVGESVVAHHRAGAIVAAGALEARELAAPLSDEMERRVARLADANVVAYSDSRASAPFVGNGLIVRPWKLDIDVHRLASDCDEKLAFTLLDVVALHERLEAQFNVENAVESTATRKLSAGHRLYVDGRKIRWAPDLLEVDRPVPRSRIEWKDFLEELRHPERADDRRVYFHLQEVTRDGEIAVCILMRPLLQNGNLSIEFVPLVIPPVHPDVEALVARLPTRTRDVIGRAMRIWTPRTPAVLCSSPKRCAVVVREWSRSLVARTLWQLAARYHWFYDHGAVMSVREGVSWRDPREFDYFMIRDLIRINDQLRDRLVASIKAYLIELGIDAGQVEATVTINNIQNWSVGNVRADMIGFGNNNTFGAPGRGEADGGEER